jgi:TrmH family RNA methyltransferase
VLPALAEHEIALILDDIRDPGNLGTIIRTADWYGIRHIIASEDTADVYNPKVISATMGSFCRTSISYTSLPAYLEGIGRPVYGAFLEGEDIHKVKFQPEAMIVIGNESRGISPEVERLIRHRITIPRIGGAESLNAAIATAIFLDNLRR